MQQRFLFGENAVFLFLYLQMRCRFGISTLYLHLLALFLIEC